MVGAAATNDQALLLGHPQRAFKSFSRLVISKLRPQLRNPLQAGKRFRLNSVTGGGGRGSARDGGWGDRGANRFNTVKNRS